MLVYRRPFPKCVAPTSYTLSRTFTSIPVEQLTHSTASYMLDYRYKRHVCTSRLATSILAAKAAPCSTQLGVETPETSASPQLRDTLKVIHSGCYSKSAGHFIPVRLPLGTPLVRTPV